MSGQLAEVDASVIIATRDRPEHLRQCLESLVRLEYPKDRFEVIVVDDESAQPLDGVVAAFAQSLNLKLIRIAHSGPGGARNHGANLAAGHVLAFTDDDCEPAPDWLRRIVDELRRLPCNMAGGLTQNKLKSNPYSAAAQAIVDLVNAHYNKNPAKASFFTSNNMAVPALQFQQLSGFDPSYRFASEDRDLTLRWRHAGFPLTYLPQAVVMHSHNMSLWKFCKVQFSYGQGSVRFADLNARRGTSDAEGLVGLHRKALNWFFAPLRDLSLKKAFVRMGLLVLWQVANVAGCAYERIFPDSGSKVMRAPLR